MSFQADFVRFEFILIVSSEGQQLRYCGFGAKHEDVIIKGEPDDMKVGNGFLKSFACTEVS